MYNLILSRTRSTSCNWELTVDDGFLAVVIFTKNKNFITGRPRYNKTNKTWEYRKCRDKVILTAGDGSGRKAFCGANGYFKASGNDRYISTDNKIKIELQLSRKKHRKEKFWFMTGQKNPQTN